MGECTGASRMESWRRWSGFDACEYQTLAGYTKVAWGLDMGGDAQKRV